MPMRGFLEVFHREWPTEFYLKTLMWNLKLCITVFKCYTNLTIMQKDNIKAGSPIIQDGPTSPCDC